jgi:hypothetical protein
MAAYAYYIWKYPNPLMRIGSAMIIAGVLFVLWQIHRRGRASALPQDLALNASLEFHRRQLMRQRDLLRTVVWWYLLPMVPGLLVFITGMVGARGFRLRQLPFIGLIVGLFLFIWWINQRGADRLDRQIAELDRLENQP